MIERAEQGEGTIRPIFNRRTGELAGYKALLPREHSTAPSGVKNPKLYQQALEGLYPTKEEARTVLDAAILAVIEKRIVPNGLPFSHFASLELADRLQACKRKYGDNANAVRHATRSKSIVHCWLSRAAWYDWRPEAIEETSLQRWFDWLQNEAVGKQGRPLTAGSIQSIKCLVQAIFVRAKTSPNPAKNLSIPKAGKPNVHHLKTAEFRRLFASPAIPLADRIMIGCGTGAGLRIGELLSIEAADVHLDDHDPHLFVRYGGPDKAPTKGLGRVRKVGLFEPGLGFWRLWMRDHYRGGERVFGGARGGYRHAWPEQFPGWAAAAGRTHMSSHIMRHTYAVAMLSGSWGYEMKPMTFVSVQLGHTSIQTTQRYYAEYEEDACSKEIRLMTGRAARQATPMTAAELLGLDASADASTFTVRPFLARNALSVELGRQATLSRETAENKPDPSRSDASTHHVLVRLAAEVLTAVQSGDPTATARAVELARAALSLQVGPPAGERVA